MIDFKSEIAYARYTAPQHMIKETHQYHRRAYNDHGVHLRCLRTKCRKTIQLRYNYIYPAYPLSFNMICKKCLSTFTKQEIEDFKFWLIVRKLKQ